MLICILLQHLIDFRFSSVYCGYLYEKNTACAEYSLSSFFVFISFNIDCAWSMLHNHLLLFPQVSPAEEKQAHFVACILFIRLVINAYFRYYSLLLTNCCITVLVFNTNKSDFVFSCFIQMCMNYSLLTNLPSKFLLQEGKWKRHCLGRRGERFAEFMTHPHLITMANSLRKIKLENFSKNRNIRQLSHFRVILLRTYVTAW